MYAEHAIIVRQPQEAAWGDVHEALFVFRGTGSEPERAPQRMPLPYEPSEVRH